MERGVPVEAKVRSSFPGRSWPGYLSGMECPGQVVTEEMRGKTGHQGPRIFDRSILEQHSSYRDSVDCTGSKKESLKLSRLQASGAA